VHGGEIARGELNKGVWLAFDRPVRAGDLHAMSVRLEMLIEHKEPPHNCWCQLPAQIRPVKLAEKCKAGPEGAEPVEAKDPADGVHLQPQLTPGQTVNTFRVVVQGDFIREFDRPNRALDADHVPPWFHEPSPPFAPNGGYRTGDRVEGGTFESWFRSK
jgi:hypothetical protein